MTNPGQPNSYGNTWESEVEDDGEFVRHQTGFRAQIRQDGSTDGAPAAKRYHLYVAYAGPGAGAKPSQLPTAPTPRLGARPGHVAERP